MTSKTLATRFEEALQGGDFVVPVQAHAPLAAGQVVHIALGTGISAAPGDNDRLLFPGVILEAISATGDEGRAQIKGLVQATAGSPITMGSLVDVSSDMYIDAAGTQTDGNGFARALEAAAETGDKIWINVL